ncbi:probable sulfatase atsG [Lentisphaera araneosa HTCC2155]|uniref:Probable sulfatase atsG n=1 Tax=Lentisphaera araneosa HTCC2155 TaxID=313628 RepID=A6DSG2_9BACT|nr:sulfatase-like hydrolase/transferase [Lentisphaera araneosa]EDM25407.1 probable sulfatase atsG [Lentisphaera araneosa HTCC2155]
MNKFYSVFLLLFGMITMGDTRPNILWLTSEDNSARWLGCYGNKFAITPNLDKLASEGFLYEKCFANAPVCAPSRSTWITGIHAISMGTHPMRSRYEIPHDKIKYYVDYLKEAGYYTTNCTKTDYNIGGRDDKECWDDPKSKFAWRNRPEGKPFFTVINTTSSHESRAFKADINKTNHDPANVELRKYHPDLPDIRKNYALYHDCIKTMDSDIGAALKALEEDGLADDTIVIYCSDHGGVMPRSKRFLYESGIHTPLIIRIPEKFKHLWPADKPGSRLNDLVSFIDMPKTWLSLADAKIPAEMQGKIFLGEQKEQRKLHFSFRGRMDERVDNVRAVHDGQFLYVKNYMPFSPVGQKIHYLWNMPASQAWEAHYKANKTDPISSRFFETRGYVEELYDSSNDPDNVNNIINSPEHASIVNKMRAGLKDWQVNIYDSGILPEGEVVKRAADNNMTIYEMVREPKLYDLSAYITAADIALASSSENLDKLIEYLNHSDSGVRYWGAGGLQILGKDAQSAKAQLKQALKDDSHSVRAMSAWALIKMGDKEEAYKCLEELVNNDSYAVLLALSVIDWMGDDAKPMLENIVNATFAEKYRPGLLNHVLKKHGLQAPKKDRSKTNGKKNKKKKK